MAVPDSVGLARNRLVVLGTNSFAGKSVISAGLCRALSDEGISVAPFKAIGVIRVDEHHALESRLPRHGLGLVHHLNAARVQFHPMMNPVAIWPLEAGTGELYVGGDALGTVRFVNRDTLVPSTLPIELRKRIRETVIDAFNSVVARYEHVVIEGAGAATDVPDDDDIPNVLLARLAQAPVVLVANFSFGGAGPAIVGAACCLPSDVRSMVRGFIFNSIEQEGASTFARDLVERTLGLPLLGSIPHRSHWMREGSASEEMYEAWAGFVGRLDQKVW